MNSYLWIFLLVLIGGNVLLGQDRRNLQNSTQAVINNDTLTCSSSVSTNIPDSMKIVLDKYCELLKNDSTLGIRIWGFSDIKTTPLEIEENGSKRIQKITKYIMNKGISFFRILPKSFANSNPDGKIIDNPGSKKNNRVEISLVPLKLNGKK